MECIGNFALCPSGALLYIGHLSNLGTCPWNHHPQRSDAKISGMIWRLGNLDISIQ